MDLDGVGKLVECRFPFPKANDIPGSGSEYPFGGVYRIVTVATDKDNICVDGVFRQHEKAAHGGISNEKKAFPVVFPQDGRSIVCGDTGGEGFMGRINGETSGAFVPEDDRFCVCHAGDIQLLDVRPLLQQGLSASGQRK